MDGLVADLLAVAHYGLGTGDRGLGIGDCYLVVVDYG